MQLMLQPFLISYTKWHTVLFMMKIKIFVSMILNLML